MRTRLHHSPLHHGEDQGRESFPIQARRQPVSGVVQTLANGGSPGREVLRDLLMNGPLLWADLERQASYWTAIGAIGLQDETPVAIKQSKYAFDRIFGILKRGLKQRRIDIFLVPVQDGHQESFFAVKKMIKAAAVHLGRLQQLRHSCRGVALLPEQPNSRLYQPIPG